MVVLLTFVWIVFYYPQIKKILLSILPAQVTLKSTWRYFYSPPPKKKKKKKWWFFWGMFFWDKIIKFCPFRIKNFLEEKWVDRSLQPISCHFQSLTHNWNFKNNRILGILGSWGTYFFKIKFGTKIAQKSLKIISSNFFSS